jgi:hypothetical protein
MADGLCCGNGLFESCTGDEEDLCPGEDCLGDSL